MQGDRQKFLGSCIYRHDHGIALAASIFKKCHRDTLIADLMCGCGHVGKKFAAMGFNPLFLDLDPQNIDLLSNDYDAKVGDIRQLPFEDCMLDACCIRYGLHNLNIADQVTALSEVFRVLRPGGRFVLADVMPQPENQAYLNAIDNQKNIHSGQTPCSFFHTSSELLESLRIVGFSEADIIGEERLYTELGIWSETGLISQEGANELAAMLNSMPQSIIDAFQVRMDSGKVLFSLPVVTILAIKAGATT
jgi:SAM-dependent methyltransferase